SKRDDEVPSNAHSLASFTPKRQPKPTRSASQERRTKADLSLTADRRGWFRGRSNQRPPGAFGGIQAFSGQRQHDWPPAAPAYCTPSGPTPDAWPLASVVIFSTRASAWRNNSSQRRFSASPRS